MVKSMTGFGRGEYSDGKRSVTAEIRSVNHRYCDITVKMPRRYSFAEEKVKALVKETVRRGKVEVSVMVENTAESDTNIRLNLPVAKQYYDNLRQLQSAYDVTGDISLEYLASMPDVMKAMPDIEDEEEIVASVSAALSEACAKIDEMRRVEGAKLAEDLVMRAGLINDLVDRIEARGPSVVEEYRDRLRDRINELLNGAAQVPEERIALEAAVFADKCSITEEIVRLRSHTKQLCDIITKSNQPDGKKLDFLVQEMNREANTIGSKSNDIDITNMMIEIKSEVEKIREQVQNIE